MYFHFSFLKFCLDGYRVYQFKLSFIECKFQHCKYLIYIFPVLLMWHYGYLPNQWRRTWLLKNSSDSIIDIYKSNLIKVHTVTSMQLQFKNNVKELCGFDSRDEFLVVLSIVKKVEFEEFLQDIYIYLTRLYRDSDISCCFVNTLKTI